MLPIAIWQKRRKIVSAITESFGVSRAFSAASPLFAALLHTVNQAFQGIAGYRRTTSGSGIGSSARDQSRPPDGASSRSSWRAPIGPRERPTPAPV
jgi:hypothetical protein